MKKQFLYILTLLLLFTCCFSFVGCNAPSGETGNEVLQDETFDINRYLQLETKRSKGNKEVLSINGLKTFDEYSRIELSPKNSDIRFNHFSFDLETEIQTDTEIYITVRFESKTSDGDDYLTYAGFVSNKIDLSIKKQTINLYVLKQGNSFVFSEIKEDNDELVEFTIPSDALIQIEIGSTLTNTIGKQLTYYQKAIGDYNCNISIFNLSLQ